MYPTHSNTRKRSRENAIANGTDKAISKQRGWLAKRLRELEEELDESAAVDAIRLNFEWELGLCDSEIARRKAERIWTLEPANGNQ